MQLRLEKFTASNQVDAISFLSRYENTSIFLLGNLNEHGPCLGLHVNSGNFKLIRQDDTIICVFCLTRRGNLLIQSELIQPIFELITESCLEESIPIRGVIGDWKFAKEYWQYLIGCEIIKKEIFCSKEINYSLPLDDWQSFDVRKGRCLETTDYHLWKLLRIDYLVEQGLPQDLSDEEMRDEFTRKCKKSMIWGLFIESQLISIAELNAKTNRLATVGGVYTIKNWRMKGYGKALMKQLIFDCKNTLSLHKLIIFTGEDENIAAQKLYEALGCQKVGYMALFFGE